MKRLPVGAFLMFAINIAVVPAPPPNTLHWSADSIKSFIADRARVAGVPVAQALFIAEHESQFDPTRLGDTDKVCPSTGLIQRSRGLWQISDCYHPEIDDATAYNVKRSTAWAMRQLLINPNEWSSWKNRRKLLLRIRRRIPHLRVLSRLSSPKQR